MTAPDQAQSETDERHRYSADRKTLQQFWAEELRIARKAHDSKWREKAAKVVAKFEDEKQGDASGSNIFWANVETLDSAVFSSTPKPTVRRRYLDKNPLSRECADVVERALSYCVDRYDVDSYLRQALNDRNVPGIGLVRLAPRTYEQKKQDKEYLEPELELDEVGLETVKYRHQGEEVEPDFDEVGAFVMGAEQVEVVDIETKWEAVQWDRVIWETGYSQWEDVSWVAIDHFKTRHELRKQFGPIADKVQLTHRKDYAKEDEEKDRALVTEVYCKSTRRVLAVCDSCEEVLEVLDDPYQLESFYPFPRPLVSTLYRSTFAPKADLCFYEDEEARLKLINARISALTEQVKWRGVYDKNFPELAKVFEDNKDGEFTAIENFATRFGDKGGLDNVLATQPLNEIITALRELHAERALVIQTIYEITGISDIQRGQTDPNETATAQQMKGQFSGLRLKRRQTDFARFARDLLRLTAEYIVEHLTIEMLSDIVGKPVDPQVYAMLKDDKLRSYAVDIETDSTVAGDQQAEKESRVEFLTTFSGFVTQLAPLVQGGMVPAEVAKEMVLFVVRAFPAARQIESAIENTPLFMPMPPAMPPGVPPGMPGMEGMPGEGQMMMPGMPPEGMM